MNCPHCGKPVTPCINASEGMKVRAWWCQSCGWTDRAIGRERLIVHDPVQASIEMFVDMRIERNS